MKILYILPWISGFGGTSRTVILKANYMVKHFNYDIKIITFCQESPMCFQLDERVKYVNLGVNLFKERSLKRLFLTIRCIVKIKKEIYNYNPNILISFSTIKETSWLWMLRDKSKKVLEVHGNFNFVFGTNNKFGYWGKKLNKLANSLIKININKSDCYVVLTNRDKELYEKFKVCSPVVIPNANPLIPSAQANLDSKIVSCIGRLSQEKNFETALRIWKKVSIHFPEWRLCIYGDGEEKEKLLNIINQGHLNDSVTIKFAEDMDQVYRNTSILMMTSLYEGLPMTLIEGISYGLPCIAFDIDCGPSDLIFDENNGYLIPPFKEDVFIEKLMIMMSNNELRYEQGRKSYEISKKYSQNNVLEKWKLLFENI